MRDGGFQRGYTSIFFVRGDGAWCTISLLAKQYSKSYDIGLTESYLSTVKTIMKIKLNGVQINNVSVVQRRHNNII